LYWSSQQESEHKKSSIFYLFLRLCRPL